MNNHLGAENSLLYPSFLELRNWGGNVSKQLAQGCYPMEWWRDPGFEPGSPTSNSKCANH